VLGERPPLEDDSVTYNPELLEVLMKNMSTLSSVLHKPPAAFCTQVRRMDVQSVDVPVEPLPDFGADGEEAEEEDAEEEAEEEEEADTDFGGADLMGSLGSTPAPAAPVAGGLDDLMDLLGPGPSAPAPQMGGAQMGGAAKKVWLEPSAETGGVRFSGSFRRQGGEMYVDVLAENTGQGVASDFAIQFNKNSFQLAPVPNRDAAPPSNMPLQIGPLNPGQSASGTLLLNNKGTMQLMKPLMAIQMAVKSNAGLGYCQAEIPMYVVQLEGETMSRDAFLNMWRSLGEDCETKTQITGISVKSPDDLKERFGRYNLTEVARTKGQQNQSLQYFVAKLVNNILLLAEISVWAGGRAECSLKAKNGALSEPFHASVKEILTNLQ